ncbi:hypothetical protein [Streptomyces sp. wa1063]|uniref:hypothetical protein n=1 Tax=Streptomyces sp. wa1063 TaxID=1828212 RepID=UPI00211D94D0|nr:hypothetical protein [Streptomyces sp. wa1063]
MRAAVENLAGVESVGSGGEVLDGGPVLGDEVWGADQATGGAEPVVGQSPVPIELVVHVACLGERRVPFLHREHADEVVARWSEDWPDHAAEVEEWDQWRWERQGPGGASAIRDGVPERAVVFHARALFLPGGDRAAIGFPEQ